MASILNTVTEKGMSALTSEGFVAQAGGCEEAIWSNLAALNTYLVRKADRETASRHLTQLFKLPKLLAEGSLPIGGVPALKDHLVKALARLIAYNRDCRSGKGERDQVGHLLLWMILNGHANDAKGILNTFPKTYGSWRDFRELYGLLREVLSLRSGHKGLTCEEIAAVQDVEQFILRSLAKQAKLDIAILDGSDKRKRRRVSEGCGSPAPGDGDEVAAASGGRISLVGKWLPSAKGKHDKAYSMAKSLANMIFPDSHDAGKQYRQLCSRLRAELQLVEGRMSGDRWGDIEPSTVPAKAMRKYRLALSNRTKKGEVRSEDAGRKLVAEKLEAITSGRSNKKLKTQGLMFYELLAPYIQGHSDLEDPVLESQGRKIIDEFREAVREGGFPLAVALVDVSGSMSGEPMTVAVALGLLIANVMPAPWGGRVLTFESTPHWHEVDTTQSLLLQVRSLMRAPWGGSTNLMAAMKEVLAVGIANPGTMPTMLFCFTDMQFDAAQNADDYGGFMARFRPAIPLIPGRGFRHSAEECRALFDSKELAMPHLVFWNLRASSSVSFAADSTTAGVSMLSGFSQAAFKVFVGGCDFSSMTPVRLMEKALMDPRYDEAAGAVLHGGL